jgi:hypothetical protein
MDWKLIRTGLEVIVWLSLAIILALALANKLAQMR